MSLSFVLNVDYIVCIKGITSEGPQQKQLNTNSIGHWVDIRAGLAIAEERQIS
jgi:hypothetical protein